MAVVENPNDRRSFHVRITDVCLQKLSLARSDVAVFVDKVSRRYSPATIGVLNEFARMPA